MIRSPIPRTPTPQSMVLQTAFKNYSPAERVGVLVFGVILPLIMIPVGVYLLFSVGPQALSLSYILPILGAVMMFVILGDHARQTIALHAATIETRRLWRRQRADARDVVFVLGIHRNRRHAVLLVKRDNTAVAFGPGLSLEDLGRARSWARAFAERRGIPDEGDVDVTGRSDASRVMMSLLSKYDLGRGGHRR